MQEQLVQTSAMAFYHEKGFVPSWHQAQRFAGAQGRIATLPDVISARLATPPDTTPWSTYFTTLSAEYRGLSRAGNEILIVAHGVGPMSNLDGILAAYGYQFNDKTRSRVGGRISQELFLQLESGKFGDVAVVDLKEYLRTYEYPFSQVLTASEAMKDPLVRARLGDKAEEYIRLHTQYALAWHQEQSGIDAENRYQLPNHAEYNERRKKMHGAHYSVGQRFPRLLTYILQLGGAANGAYERPLENGLAYAHHLSIGQLMHLNHEGGNHTRHESLVCDIGCHGWHDGTRLIGVSSSGPITDVHPGANSLWRLMGKHWQKLMRSTGLDSVKGFFTLIEFGGEIFTSYAKKGDGMDQSDPEYLIQTAEKVAGPETFRTTIGGYHGFFKYDVREVRKIAPPQANAYKFVGDVEIKWAGGNPTHHVVPIEFYRVKVDATKRLPTADEVRADYDLMISLVD